MTSNGSVIEVKSPADGSVIGSVTFAAPADAPDILRAARQAGSMWADMPVGERTRFIEKLKAVMVRRVEEITDRLVTSTGKVPVEALMSDVIPTLDAVAWVAKRAEKILAPKKVSTPISLFGRKSRVTYAPRGAALVISPWNYPLQLAMVPAVEALAAGNAVVIKPSEVTPLVGVIMEDLFREAGFPDDVVQVVHGAGDVGAALVEAEPDYVFFTGSVDTGRKIGSVTAEKLIPNTLELGGKDPMIVFADADIPRAAAAAAWGAFSNAGQMCMAVERIYVESSIHDDFVDAFLAEVKRLRVGRRESDDIGSMIDPRQVATVRRHYESATGAGGEERTGNAPSAWETTWLPPMILTGVEQHDDAVQEETFGPLVPVLRFSGEDEAVRLANDSPYGLNASVFSSDGKKARRVAGRLVSGAVVINDVAVTVANHGLPFGGEKASGIGRYHGQWGLHAFSRTKSIMESTGRFSREVNWFPYAGKFPHLLELVKGLHGGGITAPVRLARSFIGMLRRSRR